MPGISGSILSELLSDQFNIPFVFFSALDTEESMHGAMRPTQAAALDAKTLQITCSLDGSWRVVDLCGLPITSFPHLRAPTCRRIGITRIVIWASPGRSKIGRAHV